MLLTLLIALLTPQTLAVTVPPNTPFRIAFAHEAEPETSFRWYCDGTLVRNFTESDLVRGTTRDVNGRITIEATVYPLPLGKHECQVAAYNAIDEARSALLTFPVGTAPSAPVELRIIVTIRGG